MSTEYDDTVRATPPGDQLDELLPSRRVGASWMSPDEQQALTALQSSLFGTAENTPQISRYALLAKLGAGGNGVVYRAYDPKLRREVAIKLLDPSRILGVAAEAASKRLVREAQAIAQLSHPNIVSVHDVGSTEDGQVFMVMELVEGQTLAEWIRRDQHDWRAAVDVFGQAGRGLASAHAAGVIHRDFKPANAIIGDDGVVRVLDFGLAVLADDDPSPGEALSESPASDEKLTETGMVMGTPAYMSPEHRGGADVDERSDQFSYCVAFFEALYGRRPFPRTSLETARVDLPQDAARAVPTWLQRVVLRGLDRDPDRRWPSMDALLTALARDQGRTQRRGLAVAAVGATAIVGAAIAYAATRETPCRAAADHLADVWDGTRQDAVRAAMVDTGAPYAQGSWERVRDLLDTYSERWVAARQDACEATHIRNEQSAAMLDRRMACLDQRLEALNAVVGVLADVDTTTVANAVKTASGLPGLERCSDRAALSAAVPLPSDPAVAETVARARERIAEIDALRRAGRVAEAVSRADGLVADVADVDYVPLRADVAFARATAAEAMGDYTTAEEQYLAAYMAARACRDDQTVVRTAARLAMTIGARHLRFDEAQVWARVAEAEIAGRWEGRAEHVAVLSRVGSMYSARGDFRAAESSLSAALEIARDLPQLDGWQRGLIEVNLAVVVSEQGRNEEALEHMRHVRELYDQALGPGHPDTALLMQNTGAVFTQLGRHDEAIAALEESLSIAESLGKRHPLVAGPANNLGGLYIELGRPEGKALIERALAIWTEQRGPDDPEAAMARINLGNAYVGSGDLEAGLEAYRAAQTALEASLGPKHRRVALALASQASAHATQGAPERAVTQFRRAVEIWDEVLGGGDRHLAPFFFQFAEALEATGERDEARKTAQRARALLAADPADERIAAIDKWLAEHPAPR